MGWVLAVGAGLVLGTIQSDSAIEITLTTILAYCSFLVAEQLFYVSGIMAVVAAGLTLGSWGKSKVSPSTETFMEHFWEYRAYLANALILLIVVLQTDLVMLFDSAELIGAVVLAMLISRLIVVFGLVSLFVEVKPLGSSSPAGDVLGWSAGCHRVSHRAFSAGVTASRKTDYGRDGRCVVHAGGPEAAT